MANSASSVLGGTSLAVDASMADSNNIAKSISSGTGATAYGFQATLVDSSIGTINTSDYGAVTGALGLASKTVDNANAAFMKAANLEEFKLNPAAWLTKPLMIIGGVVALIALFFVFRRKKHD